MIAPAASQPSAGAGAGTTTARDEAPRLDERPPAAARAVRWMLALVVLAIAGLGVLGAGAPTAGARAGESSGRLGALLTAAAVTPVVVTAVLAVLVVAASPPTRFRGYLAVSLTLFAAASASPGLGFAGEWEWLGRATTIASVFGFLPVAYFFPDGRAVPRRSGLLVAVWVVLGAIAFALWDRLAEPGPLLVAFTAAGLALVASCIGTQAWRYARVSGSDERAQTRWVLLALALVVARIVAVMLLPPGALAHDDALAALFAVLGMLSAVALPAAIGFSMLRHRLFDADRVLDRMRGRALAAEEAARSRAAVIAVRDEERRRIRRDLHDGLGPLLAGIGQRIDYAASRLDSDPERARDILASASAGCAEAIDGLRAVVEGLRPEPLERLGLERALREAWAGVARPVVSVSVVGPLAEAPEDVAASAYRVAMEAVSNAVRHSGASSCTVEIVVRGPAEGHAGELRLEVVDDGRGIRDARLGSPGVSGNGLTTMRERVVELGGAFEVGEVGEAGTGSGVGARPGAGTAVGAGAGRMVGPGTRVRARIPFVLGASAGQSVADSAVASTSGADASPEPRAEGAGS